MSAVPARSTPVTLLVRPFERFFALESASGILLLAAAAAALLLANSPLAGTYVHLWETPVSIGVGGAALGKSLHHWINDGLMAVFFFVVGLELKREVLIGELASAKRAALSVAAAIGGMAVPALIYFALNRGGAGAAGWGIPMATDIAFALGVLALLGSRVPLALKVFVTAVAIVDDLGAVLVIALFYTAELSWNALGLAGLILALLVAFNLAGVRRATFYIVPGLVLWLALLQSGVHATIAGVLLALTIPAQRRIDAREYLQLVEDSLREIEEDMRPGSAEPTTDQRDAVHSIKHFSRELESPLARLEHGLHPWVAFFIMPVFAFANAGVPLAGDPGAMFGSTITLGVLLGLLLGKPVGILAAAALAVRAGVAALPEGVDWRQLAGVALLCGIGFTMSLFIATLAFDAEPLLLDQAKVGVLAGSLLSGVLGGIVLVRGRRQDA